MSHFFDSRAGAAQLDGEPWREQVDAIVAELPQQRVPVLRHRRARPALCPHTGTPVPGGLSFDEAVALLAGSACARARRIVGLRSERGRSDGGTGSEWDGNVGARLLYKMIGWTLVSQNLLKG